MTAKAGGTILIQADEASGLPMVVELPQGRWQTESPGAKVIDNRVTLGASWTRVELAPIR